MFATLSEDSLNYRLIMEGFYYDAEIEHITEIVKNNLYFAVLEGENNKVIKNTHDTYYFTVDEELVYVNYYYDFGPLNISCLYKYCHKLNGYLQYSQGMKRVVHYTTANPWKRVNAAFLMGCYTIIYLKMEPKDIYRILLTSGGPFKPFVDASQGISQYTIRILDCFQAIQKALLFNFFNFNDFNVNEYDLYDKLQNGDMNWLLPRKFLAFIGPTESELMNGHSPSFYIKYFLDNDIKTVIRLNNKVYDSSAFTKVGIEHHELFFPDGTVPSKEILIRFLNLCENARAAIAVHCKAGLGRTGSLIGAYIVKHYRMTAREAIAWMRICRPGSVIGQQQGWLEKIENWLWRQGSQYRLQHFGEGDKIPHHKYGIYSKEWPREREKIIRQVQRRKLEAQINCSQAKSVVENSTRLKSDSSSPENHSIVMPKKAFVRSHSRIQHPVLTTEKEEEHRKLAKLLNKIQKNAQDRLNVNNKCVQGTKEMYRIQDVAFPSPYYREETSSARIKPKHLINPVKYKESSEFEEKSRSSRSGQLKQKRYINTTTSHDYYEPEARNKLKFDDDLHEVGSASIKTKRSNQSKELVEENNPRIRLRKHFQEHLEQTQGDKLNEIKAQRFASFVESEENTKVKQVKPRRRLTNVTNANIFNKPRISTSKKHEVDAVPLLKKSQFEQRLYPSRA